MALIKCPECGKEISDMATTCIYCGYPIKTDVSLQRTTSTQNVHSANKPTSQVNNSNNSSSGKGGCLITIVVVLLIGMLLSMCSSGSGSNSGDRTCAWCNGTGYSGNGATNVTEYVFMKTPCKHCGGDGHY